MQAATSQTSTMQPIMRRGVRLTPYSSGFVIAQYRSTEMAHRFKIEAVQESTSNDTQMSQNTVPNFHSSSTSYMRAGGITRTATQRSEMASETSR